MRLFGRDNEKARLRARVVELEVALSEAQAQLRRQKDHIRELQSSEIVQRLVEFVQQLRWNFAEDDV